MNAEKVSRSSARERKPGKALKNALEHKGVQGSKVHLSNDDVGIISLVVQQKGLPEKYLISYARKSGASKDAIQVISAYLKPTKERKSAAHSEIASEFDKWIKSFSFSYADCKKKG
jgi:hypothetical protein